MNEEKLSKTIQALSTWNVVLMILLVFSSVATGISFHLASKRIKFLEERLDIVSCLSFSDLDPKIEDLCTKLLKDIQWLQ